MTHVTICIPVAGYHESVALTALESARQQTVPCAVLLARDTRRRGAGYARNRALERVRTAFTVFLDADDTMDPTFVETCLAAWTPGRYVYTDWLEDQTVKAAPETPFVDGSWHCITTLVPTAYLRHVGGFDETLPGGEDTALYLALMAAGICGRRVREPLFSYGSGGQRGKAFMAHPERGAIMARLKQQYGGEAMACCGESDSLPDVPAGEAQPGDVLALAIWGGNRIERGRITGRLYPRAGNGKQVWVDPRDVQARPDLWRMVERKVMPPVEQVAEVEPGVIEFEVDADTPHGVQEIAKRLWPDMVREVTLEELQAVAPAQVKPNAKRVSKLAKKARRG